MRFEGPAPGRPQAWLGRSLGFWFDSLQGRFTLAMLAGLLIVQLLVNLLWYRQAEQRVRRQAEQAAHHVASGVLGALRALRELPAPYRPLLIEQLRTMGGTRFLVFLNDAEVPTEGLPDLPLARSVEQGVHEQLSAQLAPGTRMQVVLASPQGLRVAPGGTLLADLPDSWIDPSLLASERPASFVVVQVETEPGHWLYLTSAMPDPYFLEQLDFFTWQRLAPQLLTLCLALALTVMAARTLTRPLRGLSRAAALVGHRTTPQPLRMSGTSEERDDLILHRFHPLRRQRTVEVPRPDEFVERLHRRVLRVETEHRTHPGAWSGRGVSISPCNGRAGAAISPENTRSGA